MTDRRPPSRVRDYFIQGAALSCGLAVARATGDDDGFSLGGFAADVAITVAVGAVVIAVCYLLMHFWRRRALKP